MTMSVSFKKPALYNELVEEYEVFENLYDAVIFMAMIGYLEDNVARTDFRGGKDGVGQGNIRIESFYSEDLYRIVGSCLAYQDTGDPDALVDIEQQAEIISQYATGGLEIAEREFGDIAGDPTDAIVNYINNSEDRTHETGASGILVEIQKNFDDQMMNTDD